MLPKNYLRLLSSPLCFLFFQFSKQSDIFSNFLNRFSQSPHRYISVPSTQHSAPLLGSFLLPPSPSEPNLLYSLNLPAPFLQPRSTKHRPKTTATEAVESSHPVRCFGTNEPDFLPRKIDCNRPSQNNSGIVKLIGEKRISHIVDSSDLDPS